MEASRRSPVQQQDILVLLADGAAGPYPLDPIRLMKGAFLVSQRGRPSWRRLFRFRPYDYGPFDVTVYRARDALLADGLFEKVKGGAYARYRLTEEGHARAAELEGIVGTKSADWVRRIGRYVTSRSFSRLLSEIYETFPDYAERSVVARR